jgi:VanZ family protein
MHCDAGVCLSHRRWLPPLIWAGVILVITSVPGSFVPSGLDRFDKVVHFTMYGVFAALLAAYAIPQMGRWRGAFIALALASAFGAADEWHQGFVPGRDTDVLDWQADTAGALVGALAAAVRGRTTRSR